METFLGAIEEHQVTLAPVVPPIALGILRHPIVAKYVRTVYLASS
jgi:hypothetical protein